jgi:hypothetical protein
LKKEDGEVMKAWNGSKSRRNSQVPEAGSHLINSNGGNLRRLKAIHDITM